MRGLLLLLLVYGGCCWLAKRDCFPPCDPVPPQKVVKVEVPCELPQALKLEAVKRSECPEDIKDWACYQTVEAGKLAHRLASMKDWIAEAKRRCSPPASQPESLPATP